MQDGDLTGRTLGGFEIQRKLGAGGMAIVYKAHEGSLNRVVALKVINTHLAKQPDFVERFYREARAAAQLSHSNIVQIHAVGDEGGVPYFSMEYVKGQSIQALIEAEGFLTPRRVVTILDQTAQALAAAHEAGIVHRDIKPSNIMLDASGRVKVTDFGIAQVATENRLTQTGMMLGTPGYMSPEQCLGEKLDARSDIYSLGVTAYEMLSGCSPYQAETPAALVLQIVDAEPPPLAELNPTVPPGLQDIVAKMLRKRPEERFQSAEDLVAALKHVDLETPAAAAATANERTVRRSAGGAALGSGPAVEPTRIKPAAQRGTGDAGASGAAVEATNPVSAAAPTASKRLRPSMILALTGALGGAAAAAVLLGSGLLGTQSVGEPAGATAGEKPTAAVAGSATTQSSTAVAATGAGETSDTATQVASPTAPQPSAEATATTTVGPGAAVIVQSETAVSAPSETSDIAQTGPAGTAQRATTAAAPSATTAAAPSATTATVQPATTAAVQPATAAAAQSEAAPLLAADLGRDLDRRNGSNELIAKAAPEPKPIAPAPDSIVTLMEGDYEHIDIVRAGVESAFAQEGFRIIDFVPPGSSVSDSARFQIVSTAKVVAARELVYFGRTQLQQTVALTVQATDLATGARASGPYTASIDYTSINLQEKITRGANDLAENVIRDLRAQESAARSR
jgi:serine/threonine-protein kinase